MTPVMVLLLATFGLAGVLTYQAVDATRSHRKTAERALKDHATFAAWEYSRLARKELEWHVWNALKPLIYFAPADPTAMPTPHQLAESRGKLADCDCPTTRYFRSYFAVDLQSGHTVWHGQRPEHPLDVWVSDTVYAYSQADYSERWDYALLLGRRGGGLQVLAYSLRRDKKGKPRIASGVLLDPAVLKDALGWPYEEADLLPRALTGEAGNAKVLSLAVKDPAHLDVYRGGDGYAEAFAAVDTLGAGLGGLTATVQLNPAIAQRLVIGGLPRSRVPLLLGLLTLTAGLVAVTLRQLRKEYELARLRSDFVSGVSHELRTPLAQIRMFSETLALERVRSPEEARRALEIVVRESERLSHLVDNVLQFSRSERGNLRLAPEPTRLDLLLRDVVDSFRPLAEARQVKVRVSSEPDITATVDSAAVRQVLLNLLDNAVKYGPAGQSVAVALARQNGDAVLSIEDQGPGIPAAAREKVWEPYWRLPRERESAVGGSGIGLAVVKDLVVAHGGSVAVADGERGGTRFSIRLPRAE